MRLLITGAMGFIGKAILSCCVSNPAYRVRGAVRSRAPGFPAGIEQVVVGDLAQADWMPALSGVDAIVHTAGRVHQMVDSAADPLAEFRRVNVAGTLNLARQAVAAGVRRFVFLSSIKVNGEGTSLNQRYIADDLPDPVDPYGISKLEAEQGLRQIAQGTGLEVVIIRPVLVYGPGVKANFLCLMRWLHKGIPLPLGDIENRRSLVALDNLVNLIITCLHHTAAANQTFLVSDGEDLSTPALVRRAAAAMGKPARLISVPVPVLRTAARWLGQAGFALRLCDSLQVDISKTRDLLGWTPPVSVDDALKRTAQDFLANRRHVKTQ